MLVRLTPVQKKEFDDIINVILSLIDRMKGDAPLHMRYSQIEAYAYHNLGCIALEERTEESARRALTHFENALIVNEAIGNVESIAAAKTNIALAKSKYEVGNM